LRLLAVCSASALSILYNPDFVHVGFIAAPFFVFAVETIEAGLRPLGDKAVPRLVAAGLSGALLVALAAKLWTNLALARASHPIRYDTAFGRVDLEDEKHRKMIARTRQLLERVDASQMFAYPVFASLYLTTGASNPTRFQLLLHDYNSPEHREEALNDLETKQVPLLVVCEKFVPADDPIVRFAREHYRVLHEPTVEDLPCVTFGRVDMDFGVVAKPGRVDPVR